MTSTINNIPVFDALITDEECGMMRISLVDDPAVMSNFLAFKEAKVPVLYSVQDSEKRIVRGVVMRADFPIYRSDEKFGEFYIIYKAEEIRKMAEKYLSESRQNLVNIMHQADSDVEGVQMVQWFIKDTARGINPEGFEDIKDGSLFAEFHIVNNEVWEAVKSGSYKGFSLEGVFTLSPDEDQERIENIVESLDGKFSKTTKQKHMTKIERFKAAIAKAFAMFANITTDKGVLAWDGDEDIKVGDAVFIEDEEGNRTPAEDGEYKCEDGRTIVVAEGLVAEIKEAEVATEEPSEEAAPEASEDESELARKKTCKAEGEEPTEGEEPSAPEADEKDARIAELEAENESLKAEKAELEAKVAELEAKVEEMVKMSAARPAHEEVETSVKMQSTGNKGLDRVMHLINAR